MALDTQRWASQATREALTDYPCFRCLSDTQLQIVLALMLCRILATNPGESCTPAAMVELAMCAPCFSDRQLMQMLVAMVTKYAADNGLVTDVDQAIQDAVCLNCVDPHRIRGMIVDGIQQGINNGTLFCRS